MPSKIKYITFWQILAEASPGLGRHGHGPRGRGRVVGRACGRCALQQRERSVKIKLKI